jgi:hypothetical protein
MNYPIATWQRSASEKINYIFNTSHGLQWEDFVEACWIIEECLNFVIEKSNALSEINDETLTCDGYLVWERLSTNAVNALKAISYNISEDKMLDILVSKQRDYGPNNISKFGLRGLIIRTYDKVARLSNLLKKSDNDFNTAMKINSVSGETIVDTLIDIIGYSIIALMWQTIDEETNKPEFLLPLY